MNRVSRTRWCVVFVYLWHLSDGIFYIQFIHSFILFDIYLEQYCCDPFTENLCECGYIPKTIFLWSRVLLARVLLLLITWRLSFGFGLIILRSTVEPRYFVRVISSIASHADVLRDSSRVSAPRTSVDLSGKRRRLITADRLRIS